MVLVNVRLAALAVAVLTVAGTVSIRASDPQVSRHTIDGGGVMRSAGAELELSGTIGQPDTGVMAGGNLQLTGGFWFSVVPGDCNSDGGVNLFDHADRAPCLGGPGITAQGACICFDLDADRDVDLSDAAAFQLAFAGG